MALETNTIDFETDAIGPRPKYPPVPVGVAIEEPGRQAQYLAWGHPSGNNCTKEEAKRRLRDLWREAGRDGGTPLAFHHGKFDMDVAETHLGLRMPPPLKVHDSLFLLALDDPHAQNLSLKPSAERILGLKPKERDAVRDWLIASGVVSKQQTKGWGAHISKAPGELVGRYAIGDVVRTRRLLQKLHHSVVTRRGMGQAYDRERLLLPILLRNEREGIRVDLKLLKDDVKRYGEAFEEADRRIRRMLKAPNLNVDANEELAEALDRADDRLVDHGAWLRTPSGGRSTSKESIDAVVKDKRLRDLLVYRGKLATCLRTFMRPWLETALATGGMIHTNWNQVRQHDSGGASAGARTNRLSSNPNFQNVPKQFKDARTDEPLKPPQGLPPLPMMRRYLVPDKGQAWGHRDYSQQEFRILGHYEDGPLLQSYLDDPSMDVHDRAGELINGTLGTNFGRRPIKNTGFGLIYGMGVALLAAKSGTDSRTARTIKGAYLSVFPGIKDLQDDLKDRAKAGEPIHTWGGREYYCEEPKFVKKRGRVVEFDYKLLNYLIQGSAADCTKEALIRYDSARRDGRLLLTVHDEINISAPKGVIKAELLRLREAMESVEFDVPMMSDAAVSTKSWADLEDLEEKRTTQPARRAA